MRDHIERLKLLSAQELEAQQSELLDSLAAVRVALSERNASPEPLPLGPVGQRIRTAFAADMLRSFERNPLQFAKAAAVTVIAIGFLILGLFNAG